MESGDMKKLRELERENAKPKKIYANMVLTNEVLKGCNRKKALIFDDKRELFKHKIRIFKVSFLNLLCMSFFIPGIDFEF